MMPSPMLMYCHYNNYAYIRMHEVNIGAYFGEAAEGRFHERTLSKHLVELFFFTFYGRPM